MVNYLPRSITASKTMTVSDTQVVNVVNAAAGVAITLPAASGTGNRYEFVIGTTITSNSTTIKVANSSDVMTGNAIVATDNASDVVIAFETAASSDTITLNGTTTGGIKGDKIILQDVAANLWHVQMIASATGTEATPFSATV